MGLLKYTQEKFIPVLQVNERHQLTLTVDTNMQMHVHWMFPPPFVAVDHWLPVMKVLLSVERYRQQHPEEEEGGKQEHNRALLLLIMSVKMRVSTALPPS